MAGLIAEDFAALSGRIALSGRAGIELVTDEDRLRRALAAVVDNALRFSPADAFVEVAVTKREGGAAIAVRDRGPGIPGGELERIFEPFHQVGGAMERRREGFGLGLYMCRRLVTAMGGTVAVDTVLGEGSVFVVILPHDPS